MKINNVQSIKGFDKDGNLIIKTVDGFLRLYSQITLMWRIMDTSKVDIDKSDTKPELILD